MVSVIVPVYNAEKYIGRCIESLIVQTYKDFELILIDDGSKDKSLRICHDFAQKDGRIKVYAQENRGVSATRNRGIQLAKGEYILFIDSDDYIKPQMIYNMLSKMISNDSDIVICGSIEIYSDHKNEIIPEIEGRVELEELGQKYPKIFSTSLINSPTNKLYRRNKICNYFEEDMSLGEDLIFNLYYLRNVRKIYFIKDIYYIYEIHQGSLNRKYVKDEIEIAEKLYLETKTFIREMSIGNMAEKDISSIFIKFVLYGISDLYRFSEFSNKGKKQELKRWIENPNVRTAVEYASMANVQHKIAGFLIKYKMIIPLHIMMGIKTGMSNFRRSIHEKNIN